jgi:ABC-type multidrug transport system fused ATPase/permease subunit
MLYIHIAYGAVAYKMVSREEIIESAKAANAHDFIQSLPEVLF